MRQANSPSTPFLGDGGSPGVSWWYDWGPAGTGAPAGIEFDPMVWGTQMPASVAHAPYLLTFNEPDNPQQSNMSASEAAALWPQIENLAKANGIPAIVSPAVQQSIPWLQSFFSACASCQVDYVAVHFYGCSLDYVGMWIGLNEYLQQFYQFNRPLWLTEFSCDPNQTVVQQTDYMKVAVPFLESNDHVFRYSWFSDDAIPNAMLTQGDHGPLNALGQLYVSLPEACKSHP
jgi:hypothetical protein